MKTALEQTTSPLVILFALKARHGSSQTRGNGLLHAWVPRGSSLIRNLNSPSVSPQVLAQHAGRVPRGVRLPRRGEGGRQGAEQALGAGQGTARRAGILHQEGRLTTQVSDHGRAMV